MDTDDAPATDVLRALRLCASSWEPDVRVMGNIRARDIVRACTEALSALDNQGADASQ